MRAFALAAVVLVAACASRPVALVALPSAPAPVEPAAEPGPSVLLRGVTLPGYLEGFPVVVGREQSVLIVSVDTEWAERPSAGVERVLRDALSQRLEPSRVVLQRDGRLPDADLTVEFLALDPHGKTLHLEARWVFSCTASRTSRGGRTQLDVPMPAVTPSAVATATTDSLVRLADVLTGAIPTECRPLARDLAQP